MFVQIPLPEGHFSLPITADGTLDGIVMWFNLHLDHTNTISTAPSQHTTWEQAIFPITYPLSVLEGDMVILNASCSDTLISMEIESVHSREKDDQQTSASCCSNNGMICSCTDYVSSDRGDESSEGVFQSAAEQSTNERDSHDLVYFIERGDLLRLNDSLYTSTYHRAIIESVRSIREANERCTVDGAQCIALDLTQGLSLFGLVAAKEGERIMYYNTNNQPFDSSRH